MRAVLLAFATACLCAPALAQTAPETEALWQKCENPDGAVTADQALQSCRTLLAMPSLDNDGKAQANALIGDYLADKGDFPSAIASYTAALAIQPEFSGVLNNRGLAYMGAGDPAKAITDYTNAIRIGPKTSARYYNRGLAFQRSGNHLSAVGDFSQAIVLDPENWSAYRARAESRTARGDRTGARADAAIAAQHLPPTPATPAAPR
jgi:tetratricopeptide (TPR) repeat protein